MKMSLFDLIEQTKGLSDKDIDSKVLELREQIRDENNNSYEDACGVLRQYLSMLLQAYQRQSGRVKSLEAQILDYPF